MAKFSNEFILPQELSAIQHEILVGGLLGDASLALDSKFPRMKIDRQRLDRPYLEWQFDHFKEFCFSGVREITRFDKRYNKSYEHVCFRTRAVPAFLNYYHKWYGSGSKQVPEDIELTPLILAVWFADDGCIIRNNNLLTLKIATDCFGEVGANILSKKLEDRFNIKYPIYKKSKGKNQYFIKASTCAAQLFTKDIQYHIIEMNMLRKYDKWKDVPLDVKPKIGNPNWGQVNCRWRRK